MLLTPHEAQEISKANTAGIFQEMSENIDIKDTHPDALDALFKSYAIALVNNDVRLADGMVMQAGQILIKAMMDQYVWDQNYLSDMDSD